MPLKCCTQYVSKFGKRSSDWKRSVFIPIPKKSNAKECSKYHQLCSFHTLERLCSKSFKLGFSSIWTENFQMYKQDLEKAEKQSNCQHSMDHTESKRIPEHINFCFIDYAKAFECVDHNELWKILKEMGIPDHFTCLLKNLYAGQEATVRTRHGTMDRFKMTKEYSKAVLFHPAYSSSMQSTSCEISTWRNHKLKSRLPGEISTISHMQMIPP